MSEIGILTEYIIKTKKLGFKDEKINSVLFKIGWPIKKIRRAFLIVKIELFFANLKKLLFKNFLFLIINFFRIIFIDIPINISNIFIKILVIILSPVFYVFFFLIYICPKSFFKAVKIIYQKIAYFILKTVSAVKNAEKSIIIFITQEKRIFIRLSLKSVLYIYKIFKTLLINAPSKSIKILRQFLKSTGKKINNQILVIISTAENGIKYLWKKLTTAINNILTKLKPTINFLNYLSESLNSAYLKINTVKNKLNAAIKSEILNIFFKINPVKNFRDAFKSLLKLSQTATDALKRQDIIFNIMKFFNKKTEIPAVSAEFEKKEKNKINTEQKNIKFKPISRGFVSSASIIHENIFLELYQFFPFLISNTKLALKELLIEKFKTFLINPAVFIYSKTKNLFFPSPFIGQKLELEQKQFINLPGRIKFADIISLSVRMFKTRRMRTFLTVLGMSIGIGTILFLVSLGYGLQNIIFQRIASAEALLTLDVVASEKGLINLNIESLQKIKNLPRVISVSPMSIINGQIILSGLHTNTTIYAIDPMYLALGGIKPVIGESIPEGNSDKIMVSTALVSLFNVENPEDILNKEVKFNLLIQKNIEEEPEIIERNNNYKIIGVIDDSETSLIYLPLKSLSDLNIQNFSQVKVKVNSESDLEQIRQEIVNMGFLVSAVSDLLEQATKIFRTIQIILGVFGFVALIVSAIGMFNTMTISLLERTQEIGIMKALGATPRDIWLLFLFESIIMGAAGGLGGIFIGIASSQIFNLGLNILAHAVNAQSINLFQRPIWFIATIAVFSIAVGFFTGLWPANRASKLNTLAALRYK